MRNWKKGETLTETLCAILITGIATALLAGLITASSRLEKKSAAGASQLMDAVSNAEAAGAETGGGDIKITVDGTEYTVPVTFYGDTEWAVAYREGDTP